MYVDRLLYPVSTLGPGQRVAIWTSGCSRRCEGCSNPELWTSRPEQDVSGTLLANAVRELAVEKGAHRLTMTGGDPIDQLDELLPFLQDVRPLYDDVLVYTGYTFQEIENKFSMNAFEGLRGLVDVIVEGPYDGSLNSPDLALRGSSNQNIVFLGGGLIGEYERYVERGRSIQNFVYEGRAISVGMHGGYEKEGEAS